MASPQVPSNNQSGKANQSGPAGSAEAKRGWKGMEILGPEEWSLSAHYKINKKLSSMHAVVSEKIDVQHLWIATKQLLIKTATQNTTETVKEAVISTMTVQKSKVNSELQAVGSTVKKVSCEIASKCSDVGIIGSTEKRTFTLLEEMSQYSWHAKVAVFAAAFAINYGEFRETYTVYEEDKNEVVKSVALLKQLDGIMSYIEIKKIFKTISDFVVKLVDLMDCVIGFGSLPMEYDLRAYPIDIKSAAYWAIESIVYCNSLIAEQTAAINRGEDQKLIFNESEFDIRINKIISIYDCLSQQYASYRVRSDGEKYMEMCQGFHQVFVRVDHMVNTESMRVIIGASDITDKCLISQGNTETNSSIKDLHNKKTMFFFSSLSIKEHYSEDFKMMERHSSTITKEGYQIIWLPIFGDLKCMDQEEYTRWIQDHKWYSYTVKYEHLKTVPQELKTYIKKEWGFDGRPMLTMFDKKGNLICKNAIHKLWMISSESTQVGSKLFGEDHWSPYDWSTTWWTEWCKNQKWGLDFLCQELNVEILSTWINSKDVVFLYGGKDVEWLEDYQQKLEKLFSNTETKHQIGYIGSSEKKLEGTENLSKVLESFWYRAQSAVTSFHMYEHSSDFSSSVTSLLSLEGSGANWVAFGCGGVQEMVVFQETELKVTLNTIVENEECLRKWQTFIKEGTFIQQTSKSYSRRIKRNISSHCYKLHLTAEIGQVVEDMKCACCERYMKKTVVYECSEVIGTELLTETQETYKQILMPKPEENTQNVTSKEVSETERKTESRRSENLAVELNSGGTEKNEGGENGGSDGNQVV